MRRSLIQSDNPDVLGYITRVKALDTAIYKIEDRIERLFASRHEYPIWPEHDHKLDALEREYHEPIREGYYRNIAFLVELVRTLREG